jgi:phosphate starvation-inducible membrane PsiE
MSNCLYSIYAIAINIFIFSIVMELASLRFVIGKYVDSHASIPVFRFYFGTYFGLVGLVHNFVDSKRNLSIFKFIQKSF